MRFRLLITPHRHVLFDSGPVDGFGWVVLHGRRGRDAPTAPVGATRAHARERASARHRRPADGTYTIETNDGITVAGLGRLVDGGDGGDTYNYSPPDDRPHRRRARRGADRDGRDRPGARPAPHRDRLHVAGVRDRRRRVVLGAVGRDRRGDGRDDARAAPRRTRSCASRTSSTTAPATTGCARTSRCPTRVDGSDAECAFTVVHRGLDRRGRHARVRTADVPVAPVRRRVRRRRRLRAPPRRSARVRGRRRRPRARAHAAARDRLALALGAVAAAESGGSARRGAAARRCSASSACSTPCYPTAATGARPTATARPTRSSSRSSVYAAAGPVGAEPASGTRAARRRRRGVRGDTAPPVALRRARVPHRARRGDRSRSSTTAHPRAAGSSTSRGGRSHRSKVEVELRPWEICTLQLA